MTMVALMGEHRVVVTARAGTTPGAVPRLSGLCGRTVRDPEVLVVPDADPGLATSPTRPAPRFFAGAPLHYVRHIRLGALCLLDPQPRDFPPADQAELERMAETVAGAIMDREFDRIAALAH
jgi:GAF domain-containing protein